MKTAIVSRWIAMTCPSDAPERVKTKKNICYTDPDKCVALTHAYVWAKQFIISKGYAAEIEWQATRNFEVVDERQFLREAAWVILASGMREAVVRAKFPRISRAFHEWHSARKIWENARQCRNRALGVFGHRGKVNAILSVAKRIVEGTFEHVKRNVALQGVQYLQSFPYLGPATSFHLAKNLGLNCSKPDRHLLRIAAVADSPSVDSLCQHLSHHVRDSVAVVDMVLWRFATLHHGYRGLFRLPRG